MKSVLLRTRRSAQHARISSSVSSLSRKTALASSKRSYVREELKAHLVSLRQHADRVLAEDEVAHRHRAVKPEPEALVVALRCRHHSARTSRKRLRCDFWLKRLTGVASASTCLNA